MRPQRFARDERGTIAVITAGVVAALVGCLVLTADFGSLYLQRRQMQRAVDLAAMAAAGTHGDQQALALAVLSANGMGAAPDFTLYSGAYDADPALSPAARFTAGALPANAARIALRAPGRVYFIQALMPSAAPRIRVAATAAVRDVAMLQIGSRLASLQNGVLDALLGNLVGGSVSLTALDYQALADAQVDLLGLAQALAARSDSSGTYADVLGADISVGDLLGALADSLSMQAGGSPAATAVGKLRNALVGQGASLDGGSLVDLGPLAGLGLGETPEGISASVSALDLLRAAAMLKGGEISADLGAAAPGLLDAKLAITIGEGARQSAWLAVGESGVSVRTAQIRLLLLLALKPVLGFAVQVPLAVEVAYGEASLAEISCGRDPASDVQVDVAARPGLAGLWLGAPRDASSWKDLSKAPDIVPAELVRVPLIASITGYGAAEAGSAASRVLTFSASQIRAKTPQTVGSRELVETALDSLFGSAELKPVMLGADLGGVTNPVLAQLRLALSALAPSVDDLLLAVLDPLGIHLGEADVRVTGVRCGIPALVL